jgi:hypothetical protein
MPSARPVVTIHVKDFILHPFPPRPCLHFKLDLTLNIHIIPPPPARMFIGSTFYNTHLRLRSLIILIHTSSVHLTNRNEHLSLTRNVSASNGLWPNSVTCTLRITSSQLRTSPRASLSHPLRRLLLRVNLVHSWNSLEFQMPILSNDSSWPRHIELPRLQLAPRIHHNITYIILRVIL